MYDIVEPVALDEPDDFAPPWIYATADAGWAEAAIDALLNYVDIVVDGVLIRGDSLNPREPVWRQLKRRLRAAGVRCPRSPEELP